MQGFIIFDYASRYAEGRVELARWVQEGLIKHKEEVVDGLRKRPRGSAALCSTATSTGSF